MQIDVMVADASHEVYVDTILDTIREAAKKRGTGIAERTHEYLATKMKEGKAIIALNGDEFAGFTYIDTPQIPGHRPGQAHQAGVVPPGTAALALGQDIQPDQRRGRDEDEHRAGIRARHLQRADRRRGVLERVRGLHQPRHSGGQEPQVLHLHGDAV